MRTLTRILCVTAIAVASGLALADGPGAGYGPGMMGGYGPGMMGGYGPGMMGGYGPGMMGGYGPGMMGGYGPGMMGGYGPGMMDGRGRGMHSGHELQYALGLSDEQRRKVAAIHDDLQSRNWEIMGKMRGAMAKLRDLAWAEPLDKVALDDAYKGVNDLRLQRFDAHIAARTQMDAVLTQEQKERARSFGPWWLEHAD